MELAWCSYDECVIHSIREKVDEENHIYFQGPATGQVTYSWPDRAGENDISTAPPSVLLLVKRNDDELLKIAAEAVTCLLNGSDDIRILMQPELCAKLKYYFGVDDDSKLQLYEPRRIVGFGGSYHELYEPPDRSEKKGNVEYDPDLICTLGGDGLLMHASTMFPGPVPPILCIAGGSLGFLTPFDKSEIVTAIRRSLGLLRTGFDGEETSRFTSCSNEPPLATPLFQKDNQSFHPHTAYHPPICVSLRMRLECSVTNREGIVRARFNVLNEVTIDRGSSPYLANLECYCDDVHLTTVQADGIIFATPTGSTAYSMAAGGSVVHPSVPAICVTPICPHVLSFRSMVFPDHVVLKCYVPGKSPPSPPPPPHLTLFPPSSDDARAGAAVAFDGKHHRDLHRGDSVQIKMSKHPVPTINRRDHSSDWLGALKRNFNFNARVQQKPL